MEWGILAKASDGFSLKAARVVTRPLGVLGDEEPEETDTQAAHAWSVGASGETNLAGFLLLRTTLKDGRRRKSGSEEPD